MSDWLEATVSQIATRVTKGTTPPADDFGTTGVNYVKVESIGNGGTIDRGRLAFVSEDAHLRALKRSILQKDDVLFTIAGTIGRASIVEDSLLPANTNQAVAIVRPNRELVLPRFLYFALRDRERVRSAVSRTVQSVQSNLSLAELGALPLRLPPLPEQQAIAEVLGALDDKIAANTALAAKAEELLHTTFLALPSAEEIPLSATAEFVNGKAFTKGASGTGRVVVRIAELNGGIGGSTVRSDAVVEDKHVARPGDILFAWSGSLTLHRWYRDEAIVNQHIFKVVPLDGRPQWLAYELVRQKLVEFKAIAADKATTMGHIQRHHLDQPVAIPSVADIERVSPLTSALWAISLNAEREALTLATTRDALLPQLMSGKLRVRDAEKTVSEVI